MRTRRVRPGRFSFTALLAAVLLAVPAATATAAQAPGPTVAAAQRLDITMQAQQQSNWCWAA